MSPHSDVNLHAFAVFALVHVDDQRFFTDQPGLDDLDDLVHIGAFQVVDLVPEVAQEPGSQF
jgi:hypothetical protein